MPKKKTKKNFICGTDPKFMLFMLAQLHLFGDVFTFEGKKYKVNHVYKCEYPHTGVSKDFLIPEEILEAPKSIAELWGDVANRNFPLKK